MKLCGEGLSTLHAATHGRVISTMFRALIVAVACCAVSFAQERDPLRDAVEWTVSLRGRMAQMANPVVRIHGTASLARTV